MIKAHIVQTLQRTASTILASQAPAEAAGGKPGVKLADPSAAYINFKAMSENVRTLMSELVQRADSAECAALEAECHTVYGAERRSLLLPHVHEQIVRMVSQVLIITIRGTDNHAKGY
jgi:hypothetical protein